MDKFDNSRYRELFTQMGYDDDTGMSLLLRTQLLHEVKWQLERLGLTQHEAAKRLAVSQPRIF